MRQRMQPHGGQLVMTTQVTTKVPPGFDGKTSWFAFEDAIDDWCDITELEAEKWGPGEASVFKRLLDREELRQPNGRGVNTSREHWDHILWKELRQFSSSGSWDSWRTIVEMETWWSGWQDSDWRKKSWRIMDGLMSWTWSHFSCYHSRISSTKSCTSKCTSCFASGRWHTCNPTMDRRIAASSLWWSY